MFLILVHINCTDKLSWALLVPFRHWTEKWHYSRKPRKTEYVNSKIVLFLSKSNVWASWYPLDDNWRRNLKSEVVPSLNGTKTLVYTYYGKSRNEVSGNGISEIQNAKVSILWPQGQWGKLTFRIWCRSELIRQSYSDFTVPDKKTK